MIRRLASLHAVRAGPVSTLRRYYQGATTSCRPSHRASLPSLGGTTRCVLSFAPTTSRRNHGGPGVIGYGDPHGRRKNPVETAGSPKFLGNPDCFCARFFDSGRTACPHYHDGAAAWPPLEEQRGLPHWDFRSSMARPQSWLSTLRRVGHPTTTQDSLPGAGQALLGGLAYPQGFNERFRVVSYISAPFPKLAWRNPLFRLFSVLAVGAGRPPPGRLASEATRANAGVHPR